MSNYEAPKLTIVGSVESVTASSRNGSKYDANLKNAAVGGPQIPILS